MTFTDFVSNYNILVHSIASLNLKQSNIPKETSRYTFTTLQNMSHSVRTTFGYYERTYGGNKWTLPIKPPPKYIRHGNVSAPAIWEIFITPILDCLWDAGHGAVFKCCITQDSQKLVVYWFIDDSKIIQISPSPKTQTKYTIKLPQSGLNIFSGESQKTDGQVSADGTF